MILGGGEREKRLWVKTKGGQMGCGWGLGVVCCRRLGAVNWTGVRLSKWLCILLLLAMVAVAATVMDVEVSCMEEEEVTCGRRRSPRSIQRGGKG
jgi:hypothetical protein